MVSPPAYQVDAGWFGAVSNTKSAQGIFYSNTMSMRRRSGMSGR
jgi:hypothetical protein